MQSPIWFGALTNLFVNNWSINYYLFLAHFFEMIRLVYVLTRRTKWYVSFKPVILLVEKGSLLRIYKAFVRPRLEYCIQHLNPAPEYGNWSIILKIEGVQRHFTCMIDEVPRLTSLFWTTWSFQAGYSYWEIHKRWSELVNNIDDWGCQGHFTCMIDEVPRLTSLFWTTWSSKAGYPYWEIHKRLSDCSF